jgi:DNA-binding LacI/PurR family transcriptional regulator
MPVTNQADAAPLDLPRIGSAEAVRALDELCASLRPGDRIPTHTELMRRFGASERAVRFALEELQREGKIIRKNGVGTFVAERGAAGLPGASLAAPALLDSRTVVVIARPDSSFFDRCVSLLYQHAESADLNLVCLPIDPATGPSLTPPPDSHRPLGFILFNYRLMAPLARDLQDAGCRVVVVGAPPADVTPEVPCVYNDHELGGYLVVRHLLDLGHRRLAFYGDADLPRSLRWRGYQRALREAQRGSVEVQSTVLPLEEIGAWTKEPELAARYFRRPDAPTAVAAWNDHEALLLLSALKRAGVRVPEEVSLTGYDALPEGELIDPPLTTVDHAIDRQLQAALNVLTRPTPPPASHTVVVLPTLAPRQSSAAPNGSALPAVR